MPLDSSRLVVLNQMMLAQGARLLEQLDERAFQYQCPHVANSSIGSHLRHVIEHYLCFINGLESGCIDYEDRQRDAWIERQPSVAAAAVDDLEKRLGALGGLSVPLQVKLESIDDQSIWTASSTDRELDFVLSHTVHHYALISVICQQLEVPTEADFGVSVATLRFRQGAQSSSGPQS